jgi:streptogramin lyase
MMDVEAMVVKEWALPSPDAFPVGLTSRDDTVFFAEVDASILGRLIVSENKVTEWELPGAGTPGWPGVCLDDSQNVWVACRTSHELIRVRILAGDTAVLSRFVVPRISSDGPTDLLFVAGPGIWFSMSEFHGGRTKIGYLDLGTMYCRQWRLPADTMNAYRIAADLCGNVWFYDNLTSLASLAPSTNTMTWYPALYPKTYPQGTYGLAVGDSGDVWMTSVYGQVFRYRNVVTGLAANNAPAVPKAGVGATPNPFRRYVRFIGTPLGVYDRSGRLVMPLPGSTWDGRTADGREVRPGVYFIRFASGQQVKLVKTR